MGQILQNQYESFADHGMQSTYTTPTDKAALSSPQLHYTQDDVFYKR